MPVTNIIVAIGFTFIHLSSKYLDFKHVSVNQLTSFIGGISLAYVFFHLIPTVQSYQHDVMETFHVNATNASHLIYGSVLAGIVVFYFLELALKSTRFRLASKTIQSNGVFWGHMGAYFLYNFIIGVLLSDQRFETTFTAIFYLLAIGLHFVTNDWVLRHHFQDLYDRYGLKLLAGSVIIGWFLGINIHIPHTVMGLMEAFVAGGLILNAIKDELPECRGNGLTSFMLGLISYTIILLAI